jgi:chlorite dismutase
VSAKDEAAAQAPRMFVKFNFFKVRSEWRRLDDELRERHKRDFCKVVDSLSVSGDLSVYTTVGFRGDTDLMIRQLTDDAAQIHSFGSAIRATGLGSYFDSPYSYLAVTRKSSYVANHSHAGQEGSADPRAATTRKYLVVYPFVKRRDWYSLPFADRQEMMSGHIETGHRYPAIRINTSYSFGIDDQEFIVAFDTDDLMQFVDLVMELRESPASAYTERDVPAFTCMSATPRQAVDALDGASAAVAESQAELEAVLP